MAHACERLGLKTVTVLDQAKDAKVIAGSPEIKGVRGTDRRRYLLDLMRVHPRDSNYPEPHQHACCVVRPELFSSYRNQNAT